jgi:hypothetical protein
MKELNSTTEMVTKTKIKDNLFDKYINIKGNVKKMNNAYSLIEYDLEEVKQDIISNKSINNYL